MARREPAPTTENGCSKVGSEVVSTTAPPAFLMFARLRCFRGTRKCLFLQALPSLCICEAVGSQE